MGCGEGVWTCNTTRGPRGVKTEFQSTTLATSASHPFSLKDGPREARGRNATWMLPLLTELAGLTGVAHTQGDSAAGTLGPRRPFSTQTEAKTADLGCCCPESVK